MQEDTQNQVEQWEDYNFCVVRCNQCLKESSVVIYKSDLTGDEQMDYIRENTDYTIDSINGGLLCPSCCKLKIVK